MLKCREITEMANQYLDDDLDLWRGLQVRMHLTVCKHCRRFIEQMRATVDLIRRSRSDAMPDESKDKLAEAFRRRCKPTNS